MGRRYQGSVQLRIYKRQDGTTSRRYRAWEVVRRENGSSERVSATSDSKAGAVAAVRQKAQEARSRQRLTGRDEATVAGLFRQWMAQKKPRVEEPTFLGYESAIRLHIEPYIGKMALAALKARDVERLFATIREKLNGRETRERTVRTVHTTLNQALRYALAFEIIAFNACAQVSRPKHTSKIMQPLTRGQANALLAAARGSRIEALLILALTCGLRQGEVFGLK